MDTSERQILDLILNDPAGGRMQVASQVLIEPDGVVMFEVRNEATGHRYEVRVQMTEKGSHWVQRTGWNARRKAKLAAQRQQHLQEAIAMDDGRWTKHTPYHWSRMVRGERLDFWPTKEKYRWHGKTEFGDVRRVLRKDHPQ